MIYFILLFLFSTIVRPAYAIYDPGMVPNNKYGIHIADFNDIPDIPALVNSSGGDWGYVTLVSTDGDRDRGHWQRMFDEFRRTHMIPIVRLATHVERDSWVKPNPDQFESIVSFFNSLNWPIQNRYIVLYNEPNHANEWGGSLDPEGYANAAVDLAQKFKHKSSDFFILPAGMDESAGNGGGDMDGFAFITRAVNAHPEILSLIDGWTSHSYPNPGFSGSVYATGRGSLQTYVSELSLLQSLGLSKSLPVFITETGWVHMEGKSTVYSYASSDNVGSNLQESSRSVWSDPRIVAVTPFVFSYQDTPFDHFFSKQLGSDTFYPQYDAYKSIPKVRGQPIQNEDYAETKHILPSTLVANSTYALSGEIINKGEGILNEPDDYALIFVDASQKFTVFTDPLPTLEPGEKGTLTIHVKTPQKEGEYNISMYIAHHGRRVLLETRTVRIIPPPSIRISAQLGWRRTSFANDITILIYEKDTLLHKITGLSEVNGEIIAPGLSNIVPGEEYRVVALIPYYLPRQKITALGQKETSVIMKRFYPLDIDKDGQFTVRDIWTIMRNPPKDMFNLFVSP